MRAPPRRYAIGPIVEADSLLGLFRAAHADEKPVSHSEVGALFAFSVILGGIWRCTIMAAGWENKVSETNTKLGAALRHALVHLTSGLDPGDSEDQLRRRAPGLGRMRGAVDPQRRELAPRERAVLRHLLDGASNRDIARELDLSAETARGYAKTVLRKLGVANRSELHRDDSRGAELHALLRARAGASSYPASPHA